MDGLIDGIGAGEVGETSEVKPAVEGNVSLGAGQTQPEVGKPSNAEGSWIPEEYRDDPGITKYKTVSDLIKSNKSLEKLIGKKTIGLPDEHSSEEDWNTFYRNCGRPETVEGYKIERLEGLPESVKNDPGVKEMLSVAHKLGLTQKQMSGLFAEYDRQMSDGLTKNAEAAEAAKGEVLSKLKQMYGADLQGVAERAEQTLKILDPEGKIDRSKLANRVEIIQLLDAVGKSVLGDRLPQGDTTSGPLGNIEEQIRAIQENPAFMDPLNSDHERLIKQHNLLQAQKYSLKRG